MIFPAELVDFGKAAGESFKVGICDMIGFKGLIIKWFDILFGQFGNLFVQDIIFLISFRSLFLLFDYIIELILLLLLLIILVLIFLLMIWYLIIFFLFFWGKPTYH